MIYVSKLVISFATERATRYIWVQWLNGIFEGNIHCGYVWDKKKFAAEFKGVRDLELLERICWNNRLGSDWRKGNEVSKMEG